MTDDELHVIGRNVASVRVILEALERELRHIRIVREYLRPAQQTPDAPDQETADDIERLRAENKRLRQYAQHAASCGIFRFYMTDPPQRLPCDCGLDSIRKKTP